jgi:acetyl esterase/lipase
MMPDQPGVETTTLLPGSVSLSNQIISLVARTGETLTVDQQVHLYAQNSLLLHPLISPVMSYLGGLPPLMIIASDKEVLRDEIIYT